MVRRIAAESAEIPLRARCGATPAANGSDSRRLVSAQRAHGRLRRRIHAAQAIADAAHARYTAGKTSVLLVGTDIVGEFGRWYRSGEILDRFEVLVYPRGTEPDSVSDERFTFLKDVPTIPVVATDIRARIRRGENPADDLPPGVWEYIKENGLYGYAR